MILLDAKPYDPAGLVSKATSAGLAMTAIDTTNLRITVTVPSHGMLWVRMRCSVSGGTLWPDIFLGVLEGASVRGRINAQIGIDRGTAVAGALAAYVAEFPIVGLTPGASITLDAAYGVETLAASSAIKYGGPDDAVVNTAGGMFVFEVWDPRPLPTAAPGAANGVLIAGSNAAPTFAGVNITGDVVMAGDVDIEGAIAVTAAGNDSAITLIGAGTGHGILATGGGSGGDGIRANATGGGNGIGAAGNGTGHGISATSGAGATGNGINATSIATNGNGIAALGNGTGDGILATGGPGAGGDGIAAAAGGGVDLRANITGNVTGNLSGSVGSVTGAVGSVTGAVGSVTAPVTVGTINANAINAAAIATGAIDADAIAADAVTKIQAGLPTAAQVADAVWDEIAAGHLGAGSFGELAAIIFGLSNGMMVIDNTTHTADGLTASRVRVFTSLAAVAAATDGGVGEGEIAVISMSATYNGPGQINVYRAGRNP